MSAPPPAGLEAFLTYRLNALAVLLNRDAARLAARHGLGLPEWRALWHLAAHGPCAAADIVARHQMDKALVSRALAGLVAKRLAVLAPDPGDARRQIARLTAAGRRAHARLLPDALARQASLRARLDAADAAALDRAVGALTGALAGR